MPSIENYSKGFSDAFSGRFQQHVTAMQVGMKKDTNNLLMSTAEHRLFARRKLTIHYIQTSMSFKIKRAP